jgi:hypothetical protein
MATDRAETYVAKAMQRMPVAAVEFAELASNVVAVSRLETAYASFEPDILY